MLHKMSELRGWTHEYMMDMDKPLFYRYYGYWYQDNLRKQEEYEKDKAKNKPKNTPNPDFNDPKKVWKKL